MTAKLLIFGKENCSLCKQTHRKVEHFLNKWNLGEGVELAYFDIDSVDGDAEASFYDVSEIPTTVIEKDGDEVARWSGPSSNMRSEEVREILTGATA